MNLTISSRASTDALFAPEEPFSLNGRKTPAGRLRRKPDTLATPGTTLTGLAQKMRFWYERQPS